MTDTDRYTFDANGYLVIEEALNPVKISAMNEALDREWAMRRDTFYTRSADTWQSVRVMEVETAFDDLVIHPSTFELLKGLMADDIAFSELSVILKAPRADTHARWHNDVGYQGALMSQSLLLISCIYYLSDVTLDEACFAVVPGSHRFDRSIPAVDHVEEMPAHVPLVGKAGTAILFHANLWHAAYPSRSDQERRTLHVYYCRPWMKPSGHTKIPPRLIDAADTDFMKTFYHTKWGAV